jgi:surfactin synthase thioesterase subunit
VIKSVIKAAPEPLTLFCFPCAGGSAATYLRWRRIVPSWLLIRPVELPGRGSRIAQARSSDFAELVERLAEELGPELPARYALFGHSLGALLAFETAHRLGELLSHPPIALLIAGCAAPSRWESERYSGTKTDADLAEELKRLNGTPAEIFAHQELLRLTLDVLRADFAVCASYRYRQRRLLHTPILAFGGTGDEIARDALADWEYQTTARTTLDIFNGGHFFLRDREEEFLSCLQRRLADAGMAAHRIRLHGLNLAG